MAVPHLYTKAHKNAIPVSKKFRGFPAGCLLRVGTRGFSLQAAAVWILRLHAAFFSFLFSVIRFSGAGEAPARTLLLQRQRSCRSFRVRL